MCGIFGVAVSDFKNQDFEMKSLLDDLFILSESRGKEASGISINNGNDLFVLKSSHPASKLIRSNDYKSLLRNSILNAESIFAVIGHSRLVTNGSASLNINNQPAFSEQISCVHNGIITNYEEIMNSLDIKPKSELDTEAILSLINLYKHDDVSLEKAIIKAYESIEGSASCAFLHKELPLLTLASNNGSIYCVQNKSNSQIIFASEEIILRKIIKKFGGILDISDTSIKQIKSNSLVSFNLDLNKKLEFNWDKSFIKYPPNAPEKNQPKESLIRNLSKADFPDFFELQRCTKCILPETFPYIQFDKDGECNYCKSYKRQGLRDHERIKEIVEPYRLKTNRYDQNCIVGLSGGRDSCYGLHYAKEVLGLKPVAFTYDWGLVTDLARRNIFRICGELGVEHILVSADIKKKRNYVRKNIIAWLKNPKLFMIPLFMAGDKQFYLHAHKLRKQLGIDFFMFGAGNTLEATDFKVGFANIQQNSENGILTGLRFRDKLKLIGKYGAEFATNPSYINSSIFDTLEAFYSTYLLKDDYTYLYHYIPWEENEVESTLKNQYAWEGSKDTPTSWRVGDGTAAFYNYIYYAVAGFTEHDTFRSNQIREGMISRENALQKVYIENQPRYETLEWYGKIIGFNIDDALQIIHKIPKLYN
jgi:glucosamine--fructose-6-phosphate aminotransferase (isomerizing)